MITPDDTDLKNAWGTYLSKLPWTHYATLTDSHANGAQALLAWGKRFVRRIESAGVGPVGYYLVVEGSGRGFPHLHMLLNIQIRLPVREIMRRWPLGFSSVRTYDPRRGAAHYITKELGGVGFDPDLWDIRLLSESRSRKSQSVSPPAQTRTVP
jgi:hypothetical protein